MLLIGLSLLGLIIGPLTAASEAANFDLPSATFREYGCDEECEQVFNLAEKQDRQLFSSDFDFDFYATAPDFTRSHPGDLLKFESINPSDLNITSGVTVYRFQYTSRALNGTFVPATGFIGLPDNSSRSDEKHPAIAFAHGTSGVFRGCPPSTTPTLADYSSWSLLVKSGYAVVAPDYAGLGNDYIEHQYLSFLPTQMTYTTAWSQLDKHSPVPSPMNGCLSGIPRVEAHPGSFPKVRCTAEEVQVSTWAAWPSHQQQRYMT